jgi:hypothetical protein
MKIKNDFVTNSSSASFVILREKLTDFQIHAIENHIEVALAIMKVRDISFYAHRHDKWDIKMGGNKITGYTTMDNFDMLEFLKMIGVKEEDMDFDESNY